LTRIERFAQREISTLDFEHGHFPLQPFDRRGCKKSFPSSKPS